MSKKDEVKQKVTVPMYFYAIIVPQLGSYYADYPVDFDAKPTACCPLHDEDTPSFRFYEETNTFSCFGCGRGGDIINLHRLFTERQTGSKPSFNDAIDFLYNYFIKGKDTGNVYTPVRKLITDDVISTNVDLIMYCRYTDQLESQLSVDKNIPDDLKKNVWKAIDDMDILIDKHKIAANNAEDYIKRIAASIGC